MEEFILKAKERFELYLHYSLSLSGGYIGAYALINRSEIFGSAQTANLIHSVTDLLGGNWMGLLLRLAALLLFVLAIIAAVLLPRFYKVNLRLGCIVLELMVVTALGFFPKDMNPMVALYPVFFIMALQWCTFGNVNGYASSTTFSTNNLKQFVSALCEYYCDKDRKQLEKAKIYGGTLLFYHLGVGAAFVASLFLGIPSVWICLIPLCLSLVFLEAERIRLKVRASQVSLQTARNISENC